MSRVELKEPNNVKQALEYVDGTRTCNKCRHFGSDQGMSGSPSALPSRCEVSEGLWFVVAETGCCKLFDRKS